MQHNTGYRPNMKCTWEEAIVIYKEMVEEVTREKQRAVIGKGPYQLAAAYKHLEVSQPEWSSMTSDGGVDHIAKVDPSWKKAGVIPTATEDKDQRAADRPSSPPPPAPFNLFVRHRERRIFKKRGEIKIRISANPELIYFHPTNACCAVLSRSVIREGRFIVDDDTKTLLNNSHKRLLFTEFSFSCD